MGEKISRAPIDQEQLAALLSGALSGRERESLLARLAADQDARLLLQMALEALDAAEDAPKTEKPGRAA